MNSDTADMEPLLNQESKNRLSVLIPYRKTHAGYEYYLQMRDAHAPTNPNVFSMFGGGLEPREAPEDGMLREIDEELRYRPTKYQYLSCFETATRVCHVYIEEVDTDFETRVQVCEGEYGMFKSYTEIASSDDISYIARTVLYGVAQFVERE